MLTRNVKAATTPSGNFVHYAEREVGAKAWAGFCRFGGVGDNLIAAAVAKPLKDLGYLVECISQEPNHELYLNNPHIDKLSVYQQDDWPKDQLAWCELFAKRSKEYDRFANLSHTVEVKHAAFPAMSSFWWPAHYRRKHFAGSYLETACDLLGVSYTFDRLFWPTEAEVESAQETKFRIGSSPMIGWCVNGTRIDKVYPQAPQTVARLIKELDAQVVLIGRGPGSPDYLLAEQTMQMVEAQNGTKAGLHHAGGDAWPLRRVLAFTQALDLVIGPDTGPMWAVALEPSPKIVLHSHASVENICKHWRNTVSLHADPERVDCFPCHRLHNDPSTCRLNQWKNGAACISDISADDVIKAARKLLEKLHA